MEIKKPAFKVLINGQRVDQSKIQDLYMTSSIDAILPSGYLIYKDADGLEWTKQRWLIGSDVQIIIYSYDNPDEEYELGVMKLLDLFNPSDIDNSVFGGSIVISFVHPWVFYQDFTDRAFGPQAGSDVINKVLEASKVKQFFKNSKELKKFIKQTDSSSQPPRYKCGESDLGFILNKILPYSTVNGQPCMMFVSDISNIFVNTWKGLYDEPLLKEGVVIVPDVTSTSLNIAIEMKKNVAKGPIIWAEGIDFYIGKDANLASQTYVKFYFDISNVAKTAIADLRPQASVGKSEGKSVNNALPMSTLLNLFGDMNTKSYMLKNKVFSDEVSLATNTNKDLYKNFSVDITTSVFTGETMTIGNVAYMCWPNPAKDKEHWVNGKWLITRTSYRMSSEDSDALSTTVTLTRPSYSIPNTDHCCIENFSLLQRC